MLKSRSSSGLHYDSLRSPTGRSSHHNTHNKMSSQQRSSSSDSSSSESHASSHSRKASISSAGGAASPLACVSALCNTILGSGMLAVPYAVAQCGFVLGVSLLFIGGTCSAFALHLLSISARTVGTTPTSFYTVAHAAVPQITFLIDLAVAIKCFGVATSYLIVVGDLLPDAVRVIGSNVIDSDSLLLYRQVWIIVFFLAIVMPLSCLRSLNALRFTAFISVAIVWSITLIVASYAWLPSTLVGSPCPISNVSDKPIDCHGEVQAFNLSLQTLKISTIFIFGFTCHQNMFSVCNELRKPTQKRLNGVIITAIGIAVSVYIIMSISGYYTFGDLTRPNILTNYSASDSIVAVARVLVAINVSFCFPLQCHPCRNSLFELYAQYKAYSSNKQQSHRSLPQNGSSRSLALISPKSEKSLLLKKGGSQPHNNNYTPLVNVQINSDTPKDVTIGIKLNTNSKKVTIAPHQNNPADGANHDSDHDEDDGVDELDTPIATHHGSGGHDQTDPHKWKANNYQIAVVTLCITLASFTISMLVTNLGTVLAVVGATGSTTISYILPGLCYVKLHHENGIKRTLAWVMLCAGCLIVPSALSFIFLLPGAAPH